MMIIMFFLVCNLFRIGLVSTFVYLKQVSKYGGKDAWYSAESLKI